MNVNDYHMVRDEIYYTVASKYFAPATSKATYNALVVEVEEL